MAIRPARPTPHPQQNDPNDRNGCVRHRNLNRSCTGVHMLISNILTLAMTSNANCGAPRFARTRRSASLASSHRLASVEGMSERVRQWQSPSMRPLRRRTVGDTVTRTLLAGASTFKASILVRVYDRRRLNDALPLLQRKIGVV